jgi:hypothetical protein
MVAKDLRPPVRRVIVRDKLSDAERKELKRVKQQYKQTNTNS